MPQPHIHQPQDTGQFVDLRSIGWLNHEDDELVLARHREAEDQYEQTLRACSGLPPSLAGRRAASAGLRKKVTLTSSSAWAASMQDDPAAMEVDSDTEPPTPLSSSGGSHTFLLAPSVSGSVVLEAVDHTYHQVPSDSTPAALTRAPSGSLGSGAGVPAGSVDEVSWCGVVCVWGVGCG
ncbi:hypothetical protein BC936DRAFT_143546, partial [Jimgerdemannia flammicorona]